MSFGYPSANNPLPVKHSGPTSVPKNVGIKIENQIKSTQTVK